MKRSHKSMNCPVCSKWAILSFAFNSNALNTNVPDYDKNRKETHIM